MPNMKHIKTIITLGIIVALVPFLGFPSTWKQVISVMLGAIIAVLAFRFLVSMQVPKEKTAVSDEANEETPQEIDEE
tara:strand:- start:18554 stop:18784 length:231 start_codon:yes stop_codon:yes gene_type:complete